MAELKIPEHIAVIMDGNGRWAKKRMMPRSYGHRRGFDVFVSTADVCSDLGVKYLTVYAFSTENWSRPRDEVDALTGIIRDMVSEYIPRMLKKNIRMNVFGDISRFSADTRAALEKSVSASEDCGGLTVNVCLSYGGRDEIDRTDREGSVRSNVHLRNARPGSYYPHRRGIPHIQFPAVAVRIQRALLHTRSLAGFRKAGAYEGDRKLFGAGPQVRKHQRRITQ